MTEPTSLESALGEMPETPAETAAPDPVEAQPEPTPAEAQEPEPTQPEPAADPEPAQPEMVPVGVVQQLRQELRELKQAQQPKPQPAPEPLDPEHANYVNQRIAQVEMMSNAKINHMEAVMLAGGGVEGAKAVDEAIEAVREAGLFDEFGHRPDAFVHCVRWHQDQQKQAQAQKVMAEIGGDPSAYRAKLEAELRAKIEAEMVAKQTSTAAAPSLANATGTGGGPRTTWGGPTRLENILPD